jgi:hypothetical protein
LRGEVFGCLESIVIRECPRHDVEGHIGWLLRQLLDPVTLSLLSKLPHINNFTTVQLSITKHTFNYIVGRQQHINIHLQFWESPNCLNDLLPQSSTDDAHKYSAHFFPRGNQHTTQLQQLYGRTPSAGNCRATTKEQYASTTKAFKRKSPISCAIFEIRAPRRSFTGRLCRLDGYNCWRY